MMMMMMIVDLYSALRRAPHALRVPVHCEKECAEIESNVFHETHWSLATFNNNNKMLSYRRETALQGAL